MAEPVINDVKDKQVLKELIPSFMGNLFVSLISDEKINKEEKANLINDYATQFAQALVLEVAKQQGITLSEKDRDAIEAQVQESMKPVVQKMFTELETALDQAYTKFNIDKNKARPDEFTLYLMEQKGVNLALEIIPNTETMKELDNASELGNVKALYDTLNEGTNLALEAKIKEQNSLLYILQKIIRHIAEALHIIKHELKDSLGETNPKISGKFTQRIEAERDSKPLTEINR